MNPTAEFSPTPSPIFDIYRFAQDSDYSALYSEYSSEPHVHSDFYEFSLIIVGEYDNVYKDKHHHLPKNSLIFFKAGERHAIYSLVPKSLHFSFVMKEALMESLFEQFFPNQSLAQLPSYIERQLSPIEGQYLAHVASQLMDNSIRKERNQWMHRFLFNALSSCMLTSQPSERLSSTELYVDDLLMRLNTYTYLHHKVAEIYGDYPLAPSILISKFKEKTGYTIVQYHTMKKLDYAAQLLTSPHLVSITEICADLNFSSLSHFSKIFKERFQVTPKEYQRLHVRYSLPDENLIGADY